MLSVTTYAETKDESTRKTLNLDGNNKELSLASPFGLIQATLYFSDQTPTTAMLFTSLKESKTEDDYFKAITAFYMYFLRNYQIGNSIRKDFSLILMSDKDTFPYEFTISVNNLRLLNNRDFGTKDMVSYDNGGMVYPLKEILKKGRFIGSQNSNENQKLKIKYIEFLSGFKYPGITESMIESFYKNKKQK